LSIKWVLLKVQKTNTLASHTHISNPPWNRPDVQQNQHLPHWRDRFVLPLSVSLYILNLNSPSGYVGGTVLSRFLAHPDVAQFNLTALVRSEEKAKKLETFGVNAVVGSLQDLELLESLASKADYVVSMVSRLAAFFEFLLKATTHQTGADPLAVKAILRGAKKYYNANSSPQFIIHTVSLINDKSYTLKH